MKLDELEARMQQKGTKMHNAKNDVFLSLGKKKERVSLTVYNERQGHFSETTYWKPVFIEELRRIYLVYGNKQIGYKVTRQSSNSVGTIQFTDHNLIHFLDVNELCGSYNFEFDPECKRYFIQLSLGEIKND